MRELAGDYSGRLAAHLAEALFSRMPVPRVGTIDGGSVVVSNGAGEVTAVRLKVKGGKYRDLPLVPRLSVSLREWGEFLEGLKGVPLRRGAIELLLRPALKPSLHSGSEWSVKAAEAL